MAITKPNHRFVDDYLSYLLGRASHAVYKAFDAQVKAAGLSSLEWRVLATLADGDGLTIGDLAHEVLALQPTLTKLIQRMEQNGWVESGADATDARCTLVHETKQGRAVVMRLVRAAKAHERETLQGFSEREVATLKKILRALIARQGRPKVVAKGSVKAIATARAMAVAKGGAKTAAD